MKTAFAPLAAFALLCAASLAGAAEIEVKMLNLGKKGPMVFEPNFIKAAPGDTIVFVPTQPGHNMESIKGMLPAGVEPFKGKFNEAYRLDVSKEGVYGVKCTPHYGMGMVALIEVGKPVNMNETIAVKHPGLAGKRFTEIFAEAGAPSGG